MNKIKMIHILELSLRENELYLLSERRVTRQLELLHARTEILKSIVHLQRELIQDMNRYEEAA